MKYFLLLTFVSLAVQAKDASTIINPVEKDKFFTKQQNLVNNRESLVGPKSALVNAGECVKFLKNGEAFWTHHETEVALVEAIGIKNIKLRPIFFAKLGRPEWTYSDEAKDVPFENQLQYEITSCPKEDDKIPEEIAEQLKKKN